MDEQVKKLPSVPWWAISHKELAETLDVDLHKGLTSDEVTARQKKYGKNVFEKEKKTTLFDLFVRQIKSPLVIVLIVAGIFTVILEDYADALIISFAFLVNLSIGILQEGRASKAFEKLNASQEKFATVLRDGEKTRLLASELVPGDIIFIETGAYVPADARILEARDLSVNESVLTGEWADVEKNTEGMENSEKKEIMFIEQPNMVWMGTLVSGGAGRAVVVSTGSRTELGRIAATLVASDTETTPLEKNIAKLSKSLGLSILVSVAFIFLLGVLRGGEFSEMILVSVAIAVGAMPEGLPAAVTVILAIGMERILSRGGLVKKLSAAETLGGATVILTDKTGTLTTGEMRVGSIVTYESLSVGGEETHTEKEHEKREVAREDERHILNFAVLSADAYVEKGVGEISAWKVHGRPTERAIMLAGLESGENQEKLMLEFPRQDYLSFQSARQFSLSLHRLPGKQGDKEKNFRIFFTGSPEPLLERADFVYKNGEECPLHEDVRKKFEAVQKKKTKEGARIVGISWKDIQFEKTPQIPSHEKEIEEIMKRSVFGGFIVLHDPIRLDVPESIGKAQNAGVRVIMVTGDYSGTAEKMAFEAGIAVEDEEDERAISGNEVEKMSDQELAEELKNRKIFARVLPHQKLRIVRVLRETGEVVATVGDGVNDAPALRNSDIGVAVGSGTEVAKEASTLILLRGGFTVLVAAIEEGRRILDNLKKVVVYLLSTSWSEVVVVAAALLAGAPLPLLPGQILWANIVGEGFMNFAFAFEPAEIDVMKRDPRDASMKHIFTKKIRHIVISMSLLTGALLAATYFFLEHNLGFPPEKTRTMVFLALSASSLLFAFSLKDFHRPIWKINIFSNYYLLFAFSISVLILALAFVLPPLSSLLSLTPLSLYETLAMVSIGVANLLIIELAKLFIFERKKSGK